MNPSKSPIECVLSESSEIGMIICPCDKALFELLNRLDLGFQGASTPDKSAEKAMSPFELCSKLLEVKANGTQRHLVVKGKASQSSSSSLVPYMVAEMEVVSSSHPEPAVVLAQNPLKRVASEDFEDAKLKVLRI